MPIHRRGRNLPIVPLLGGLAAFGCPAPPPTVPEDLDYADHTGFDDLPVEAPPPLFISPERPPSGTAVSVLATGTEGGTVTVTAAGLGCGSVVGGSGASPLRLDGFAGAQGECMLAMSFVDAGGSAQTRDGRFTVVATDPVLPPVELVGGVYFAGEPGTPDPAADAPVIGRVDGPDTFVPGSTADWAVQWSGADSTALLLQVDGYPGYFRQAVTSGAGAVPLRLRFSAELAGGAREVVPMRIALLGRGARFREWFSRTLNSTDVGTGDVQIGVTWNTATDIDLHVVEPGGTEIYYGATTSPSGGSLDLDSNPGCSIDGVNAEHVYWPPGASLSGSYTVRVHMYSDCGIADTSGTVTMMYCGSGSPRSELFSLGATGSEASFDFESNCAHSVSGTVRREEFAVGDLGMPAAGTFVPVRRVMVQVVQSTDGEVVAEGYTDAAGRYRLGFTAAVDGNGARKYRVRVVAANAEPDLDLEA